MPSACSAPPSIRLRLTAGCFAVASLFAALLAARPAALLPAAAPAVGFFAGHGTLWLGRSMVIPFRLAQAPASDQTLSASVADPSTVEILRPPAVLAGETTGFLRVRGLRVGKTRLILHGDAPLDLEIKTDPTAAVFSSIDAESGRPRIVSPVPDAVVWGQFAVGVEVFDANFHAALAPETARPGPPPAPNASATPAPTATPSPDRRADATPSPSSRAACASSSACPAAGCSIPSPPPARRSGRNAISCSTSAPRNSPPARCRWSPWPTPEGGSFVDRQSGRAGGVQESAPFTVRVLRPLPTRVLGGRMREPGDHGRVQGTVCPRAPGGGAFQPARARCRRRPRRPAAARWSPCPGGNDAWCLPFIVAARRGTTSFSSRRGAISPAGRSRPPPCTAT